MERKEFIKVAGAAALLTSVGVNITACSEDEMLEDKITINLEESPFDQLTTAGNGLLHPSEQLLLVNDGGNIRAFSSVCPHASCSDRWTYSDNSFVCNCHGSEFSPSGDVLTGPAQTGLSEYSVSRMGNTLTIG